MDFPSRRLVLKLLGICSAALGVYRPLAVIAGGVARRGQSPGITSEPLHTRPAVPSGFRASFRVRATEAAGSTGLPPDVDGVLLVGSTGYVMHYVIADRSAAFVEASIDDRFFKYGHGLNRPFTSFVEADGIQTPPTKSLENLLNRYVPWLPPSARVISESSDFITTEDSVAWGRRQIVRSLSTGLAIIYRELPFGSTSVSRFDRELSEFDHTEWPGSVRTVFHDRGGSNILVLSETLTQRTTLADVDSNQLATIVSEFKKEAGLG